MVANGSDARQLTDDGRSRLPAWSPDGTQLAYQRWVDDGLTDVYVMGMDDSGVQTRPILEGEAAFDSLTWSPDSSTLAIDAFDRKTHHCSIVTVTLGGDVTTVLESQRPEPFAGAETERSLCAGTLVWVHLKRVEASVESTPLVIDHITITDPLNGRSQVEAEVVATWPRGEFPGFHRCVFIARDQAGKEVGRFEDVLASLRPSMPVRVDASSPASSMVGECGPRLDTGTPYRYDFSNVRVTNRDVLPGVTPEGVATVTYDAKWAGGGELAGAVSCRVAVLDDGGSVVGSVGFNFYALTGSGTNLATRVEVRGTPASAEIHCSPFSG
jgi:hypothetical protein